MKPFFIYIVYNNMNIQSTFILLLQSYFLLINNQQN